jgi:hypothetical protein
MNLMISGEAMLFQRIASWLQLCWLLPCLAAGGETEWATRFETSNGNETPRYQETMDYFTRLARSSRAAQWVSLGHSPEGRSIMMLVVSKDRCFTPEQAAAAGKPIVLIQGCIHAGETEGKDAAMILARDLLINGKEVELLDHLIMLFLPILNVDGHEQFGATSRINQNGPRETGWRVTATRLNLNRDFIKADAPEMRAWLAMYHRWLPHFFYDCHTTDGQDFQYVLNYNIDTHPEYGAAVSAWAEKLFLPQLLRQAKEKGMIVGPYAGLVDERDPGKGLMGGVWRPMLSNSFATLMNRAGFLIETHSLKPYKQRVEATVDFLKLGLQLINRQRTALLQAVQASDQAASQLGKHYDPQPSFPISFRTTMERWEDIVYHGYKVQYPQGEISGAEYPIYTNIPADAASRYYNYVEPAAFLSPPLGYLVPRAWQSVVEVLRAHGVECRTLQAEISGEFETYRFAQIKFRAAPYEGRQLVTYQAEPVTQRMAFQPGDWYVPLANPRSKLIMYLLEPRSADALVGWGFFNTIFEDREYFESYVMEPLAKRMASEQPALAAEFAAKVRADSAFAHDARQRLAFFYSRSPYYDAEKNLYPIARVTQPIPE